MKLKTFLSSAVLAGAIAYGPSSLHADTAGDLVTSGCGDDYPTDFVMQAKCLDEWKEQVKKFTSLSYALEFFVEFWGVQLSDYEASSSSHPVATTIFNTCIGRAKAWMMYRLLDVISEGEGMLDDERDTEVRAIRRAVDCLRSQEKAALRLGRIDRVSLAEGLPPVPKDYKITSVDKARDPFVRPTPKVKPNVRLKVKEALRTSSRLTLSQIDAIRLQIQRCWSVPAGARDAENLIIRIQFSLNPDGSLRSQPRIVDQSRMRDDLYRATAESARRAVLKCTPLAQLPQASYEQWRDIELTFNPRKLLGG